MDDESTRRPDQKGEQYHESHVVCHMQTRGYVIMQKGTEKEVGNCSNEKVCLVEVMM